ncbi:MAG: TROVE domain protein [Terrestrivirus sp.]|uniref:TROVE domain protein n=1 Tax=Terrestrivirus sp. TaxID=2487775 RepID=A0A3G4ZLE1_9VIRU|nr:MAG: TROVE domain protein [Terrestrivirus sp.]
MADMNLVQNVAQNVMGKKPRNDNDETDTEDESSAVFKAIKGREKEMVLNSTGGFVFTVSVPDYVLRVLILGTTVPTYYSSAKDLTSEAVEFIKEKIAAGMGHQILQITRDVYLDGRAPNHGMIAMVHAMLCRAPDIELRLAALAFLTEYRTLSQLYTWKGMHKKVGDSKGFGSAVKKALAKWVLQTEPMQLAYQITKYQSRTSGTETWAIRDLLRCAHIKTGTGEDRGHKVKNPEVAMVGALTAQPIDIVLRYAVSGADEAFKLATVAKLNDHPVVVYLKAVEQAKKLTYLDGDRDTLIGLIHAHRLTREHVPTWGLKNPDVLSALLMNQDKTRVKMPMTAFLRNLNNLTAAGVFDDVTALDLVCGQLRNAKAISASRIHPVQVLLAWFTYKTGKGFRGKNNWTPNQAVCTALEDTFYLSFKNVAPTNKRIFFAIDCSGSMTGTSACPGITNAEAAALMAMVFSRAESVNGNEPIAQHKFMLFTSPYKGGNNKGYGYGAREPNGLYDVSDLITHKAKFEDVYKAVQRSDFGSTNISMPIQHALNFREKFDAFVVITDNELNNGSEHPSQALKRYRTEMNIPAKLVVVATTATKFTIADPADNGMMDICGFDSHAPKIIQDFIRGTVAVPDVPNPVIADDLIDDLADDLDDFELIDGDAD